MKVSVGFKLFGIGGEAETSFEGGFERTTENTETDSDATTDTKEVEYAVKKIVNVPPYTSIKVVAYTNWIDNLRLNYKAKLKIEGDGPSFENDGRLDPATIHVLLQEASGGKILKFKEINRTSTSITFAETGTMTMSVGLKSYMKIVDLKSNKVLKVEEIGDDDSVIELV